MKFKFKAKKIIIGTVILACVGGGVYLKVVKGEKTDLGIMVTTTPIAQKDIEESITLKAPLEGTESIEVVSRLHYGVLQINVKEGDKVSNGQVIAVLDSKKLQEEITAASDALQLSRTQINEKIASANESLELEKIKLNDKLDKLQKEYDKALNDLNEAKRVYDNIKELNLQGVEPDETVKKEELNVSEKQRIVNEFHVVQGRVVPTDTDLRTLESGQSGVKIVNGRAVATDADLKSLEIAEKSLASKRKDLEECQIKSTIDGTVTRVNIKVGRFADDTEDDKPMFIIENIENLQMKVKVSEYDIAKIKEGQKVEISADILGEETVEGIVSRISPTGEVKDVQSTERVIPIQVDVMGKNEKLIAGITAKAKIQIAKSDSSLVVPIEAVLENEDEINQVYKVNEQGLIEIIPVELGIENDIEIQIISDRLKAGDNLILGPTLDLTEGTLVNLPPAAVPDGATPSEGTDADTVSK